MMSEYTILAYKERGGAGTDVCVWGTLGAAAILGRIAHLSISDPIMWNSASPLGWRVDIWDEIAAAEAT